MMEFCGVCGGCVGYIFVTASTWGQCLKGEIMSFGVKSVKVGMGVNGV